MIDINGSEGQLLTDFSQKLVNMLYGLVFATMLNFHPCGLKNDEILLLHNKMIKSNQRTKIKLHIMENRLKGGTSIVFS